MCHFISTSWTSTSSSNSKFTIKFGFKFKNSNMKRKEKERKKRAKNKLLHGPKPLPRPILTFSSARPKFYSTACAADWRVPVASHLGLSTSAERSLLRGPSCQLSPSSPRASTLRSSNEPRGDFGVGLLRAPGWTPGSIKSLPKTPYFSPTPLDRANYTTTSLFVVVRGAQGRCVCRRR
jgi:hypothetical protein